MSISESTWSSYSTAWRCLAKVMLQMYGVVPQPVCEHHLEEFVTVVSSRLSYKSIRTYLSGIKFMLLNAGQDINLLFRKRLYYLLRGVRRSQGSKFARPKRIPITLAHLRTLMSFVARSCARLDALCFRAMFLLAFFALLRVSEYTCPSATQFDPEVNLAFCDVVFSRSRNLALVRIKASKTDPFRTGCTVRVAKTGFGGLCPVEALRAYMLARSTTQGPLFLLSDGNFVTRRHVSGILQAAFPLAVPGTIASHSFRIGGATLLCSLGVPDATIQILGRWSSSAFRAYLRISDDLVSRIHGQMARARDSAPDKGWEPDAQP